jgi:hypothetical protein
LRREHECPQALRVGIRVTHFDENTAAPRPGEASALSGTSRATRHRCSIHGLDRWIIDALTEELTDDLEVEGACRVELVAERLFRVGAEPLVVSSRPPPAPPPRRCDVAELSSLLEGES